MYKLGCHIYTVEVRAQIPNPHSSPTQTIHMVFIIKEQIHTSKCMLKTNGKWTQKQSQTSHNTESGSVLLWCLLGDELEQVSVGNYAGHSCGSLIMFCRCYGRRSRSS